MKCDKHGIELILVKVDDNKSSSVWICKECKSETYGNVRNKD